ncbi:hypothetical protein [Azospirillum palustre]
MNVHGFRLCPSRELSFGDRGEPEILRLTGGGFLKVRASAPASALRRPGRGRSGRAEAGFLKIGRLFKH